MIPRMLFAIAVLIGIIVASAVTPARDEPKAASAEAKIPAGVSAFVTLDMAKAWEHKAFAPVRVARGNTEFAWAVQSLVGITPAEMARITVFWHSSAKDAPYVLLTAKKPIDPKAIAKTIARPGAKPPKERVGKVVDSPGAEFPFVVPVDAKTVLLAPPGSDPAEIEKLAGPNGPLVELTASPGKHTLFIGLDVKSIAALPLPVGGPLLEAETAILTLDLGEKETAPAELRLAFANAARAAKAAPFLKTKLDELAGWAAAQEKRASEKGQEGTSYPAPLLGWIATSLKDIRVVAVGKWVHAKTAVKLDEGVSALLAAVPDAALAPRGASAAENNLKQIGIAIHNFASANNDKLPGNSYDKAGKPLLSWRVHILPYLEQANVYSQFKLDEPWDSEHNKPLGKLLIKTFQVPGRPAPQPWETYFRSFISPKDVKGGNRAWLTEGKNEGSFMIGNIPDGTSNTWAVVEAADAVPWSKPDDLAYDGVLPLPKLGGPSGTYVALFGDGSTRTFRRGQIDDTNLRWVISCDDGMVVNIPGR